MAWVPVRPLRGRLQPIREKQTGRNTGDGIGGPVCGRQDETQGEPGEKRGG